MIAAVAMIGSGLATAAHAADPVELAEFMALNRPEPTAVVRYGEAPTQAIDLFLPRGEGPYPAVLIHGGCWMNLPGAGREQLRQLGADLASRGIAVWSIGYRRADENGGGYPGTFQDVGVAIDLLRSNAARYRLDLSRTVLIGHSAGGHLALWAAARDQLPPSSPLHDAQPFVPGAVISLAGIGDLEAFARFVPVLCGPDVIERLASAGYSDISPAELPPPRGRVVMMRGTLDRLVPPYVAHDYARAMQRKNAPQIDLIEISDAGHFDLVTPGTHAWDEIRSQIVKILGRAP